MQSYLAQVSGGAPTGDYFSQVEAAFAELAALLAILAVVWILVRATHQVLKVYTRSALPITALLVATVVVIGLANG